MPGVFRSRLTHVRRNRQTYFSWHSLPVADAFTCDDNTPLTTYSNHWALVRGDFIVYNNNIGSNTAGDTSARWTANTFSNDQYAQIRLDSLGATGYIGVSLRNSASEITYYHDVVNSSFSYLEKYVNNSITTLSSGAGYNEGDILRLEVSGQTITPKKNGSLDTDLGSQTDSSIASGYAGIGGAGTVLTTQGDDWEAGNLEAQTNQTLYPSGISSEEAFGTARVTVGRLIRITHEKNDLSEYSNTTPGSGTITASSASALAGSNYGIAVSGNGAAVNVYATKQIAVNSSGILRFRFYLDINSLTIDAANVVAPIYLYYSGTSPILYVGVRYSGGTYQAAVFYYASGVNDTGWFNITDAPHYLEVLCQRSSSVSANDGTLDFWIDGVLKHQATGKNNWTEMASFYMLRFGLLDMSGTTDGTIYLDELALNDNGVQIGPWDGQPVTSVGGIASLEAFGTGSVFTIVYVYPIADISNSGWTNQANSSSDLYQSLDETSPDDADWMGSPLSPNSETYELRLDVATDPTIHDAHQVSYRARKTPGTLTVGLTVSLYCNATLIKSWNISNLPATWTTYSQQLTSGEAESITDYSNLRLRFSALESV